MVCHETCPIKSIADSYEAIGTRPTAILQKTTASGGPLPLVLRGPSATSSRRPHGDQTARIALVAVLSSGIKIAVIGATMARFLPAGSSSNSPSRICVFTGHAGHAGHAGHTGHTGPTGLTGHRFFIFELCLPFCSSHLFFIFLFLHKRGISYAGSHCPRPARRPPCGNSRCRLYNARIPCAWYTGGNLRMAYRELRPALTF